MITHWACPKKIRSRRDTLPRKVCGQYWTLAGLCDSPGCELDYVLSEGIVEASQFHSVENVLAVHTANQLAHPHVHWHYGDLFQVMRAYPDFNPGFINADLVQTVDTAGYYIAQIIDLIHGHTCQMNINFVLGYRNRQPQSSKYVVEKLMGYSLVRNAMRNGGHFAEKCYTYCGAGKRSTTVMGTFFYRSG